MYMRDETRESRREVGEVEGREGEREGKGARSVRVRLGRCGAESGVSMWKGQRRG